MTEEMRKENFENMEAIASLGLSHSALASRSYYSRSGSRASREGPPLQSNVERDLTFQGINGLFDSPHLESKASVDSCRGAASQSTC